MILFSLIFVRPVPYWWLTHACNIIFLSLIFVGPVPYCWLAHACDIRCPNFSNFNCVLCYVLCGTV